MKKKKSIHELCKEFPNKSYRELEKYRDADRIEEAIGMGHNQPPEKMTVFDEERKKFKDWKEMYEKEHKLRQEAEGELTILKGIETNRVKEAQDALANALEVNESHQKLNGRLQMRITELEQDKLELYADNKKLALQIEDKVNQMRRSGM